MNPVFSQETAYTLTANRRHLVILTIFGIVGDEPSLIVCYAAKPCKFTALGITLKIRGQVISQRFEVVVRDVGCYELMRWQHFIRLIIEETCRF
jgi:hypothetical protein